MNNSSDQRIEHLFKYFQFSRSCAGLAFSPVTFAAAVRNKCSSWVLLDNPWHQGHLWNQTLES